MALDRVLRQLKEVLCIPIAHVIGRWCSPTMLTMIGLVVGLCSCVAVASGAIVAGCVLWWLNRLLDGLDGVVARITRTQSDFGGYADVICDFIIYALMPISFVMYAADTARAGTFAVPPPALASTPPLFLSLPAPGYDAAALTALLPLHLRFCSIETLYVLLALLEATFFVNAASQMYLASILEKRAHGSAASGELTTITMPDGLIEGTETMALFGLMFFFPHYVPFIFVVFASGVAINIAYRMVWASFVLTELERGSGHLVDEVSPPVVQKRAKISAKRL